MSAIGYGDMPVAELICTGLTNESGNDVLPAQLIVRESTAPAPMIE
ncbi:MAG: hypothetical protein P4L33_13105 [Capsulimonadaceae bacterium]|nr:hypothetical protein [Capsulimonadaceae bacterium]